MLRGCAQAPSQVHLFICHNATQLLGVSGIREWFRWYKTPDGKPINGFGHDEKLLNADKVPSAECLGNVMERCGAGSGSDRRDSRVLAKLEGWQNRPWKIVGGQLVLVDIFL